MKFEPEYPHSSNLSFNEGVSVALKWKILFKYFSVSMRSNDTIDKIIIWTCNAFYGILRLNNVVSMIICNELIMPQSCCKEVDKKIFRADIEEIVLNMFDAVLLIVLIFAWVWMSLTYWGRIIREDWKSVNFFDVVL